MCLMFSQADIIYVRLLSAIAALFNADDVVVVVGISKMSFVDKGATEVPHFHFVCVFMRCLI